MQKEARISLHQPRRKGDSNDEDDNGDGQRTEDQPWDCLVGSWNFLPCELRECVEKKVVQCRVGSVWQRTRLSIRAGAWRQLTESSRQRMQYICRRPCGSEGLEFVESHRIQGSSLEPWIS